MTSIYQRILKDFDNEKVIVKAILSNNALIYFYLSHMVISGNDAWSEVEARAGKPAADGLLTETLIVFRRKLKHDKISITRHGNLLFAGETGKQLHEYLVSLFQLLFDISPLNPANRQSHDLERKWINGEGFQRLYELKPTLSVTLHSFGCNIREDVEEIFDESLIIFWKKLVSKEAGIYFTGDPYKLDNCRVYNRKFYQNSKLSTYLTGIAKNLFLNRNRSPERNIMKNDQTYLGDPEIADIQVNDDDNGVFQVFLYYRHFVEQRKLRTTISLLQYDCSLDDAEIRKLTGINNARIHSCRLRSHFAKWYAANQNKVPEILDHGHEYFVQREAMKERLNRKITVIDRFRRKEIQDVDLGIFEEEFRTMPEFTERHTVFNNVFYLTTTGKASALKGIPDEKRMREMMQVFKARLFALPAYQTLLFILYYASDEPAPVIIKLLKQLHAEWLDDAGMENKNNDLALQLREHTPADPAGLTDELYLMNQTFLAGFTPEKNFNHLIYTHEAA